MTEHWSRVYLGKLSDLATRTTEEADALSIVVNPEAELEGRKRIFEVFNELFEFPRPSFPIGYAIEDTEKKSEEREKYMFGIVTIDSPNISSLDDATTNAEKIILVQLRKLPSKHIFTPSGIMVQLWDMQNENSLAINTSVLMPSGEYKRMHETLDDVREEEIANNHLFFALQAIITSQLVPCSEELYSSHPRMKHIIFPKTLSSGFIEASSPHLI